MLKVNDLVPLMEEAFNSDKTFIMPVKGTSMQPIFHTGDLVELKRVQDIKKNDVIFYQRNDGSYVLHRVYKVLKDSYVMIGDHQTILEYGITKEMCLGKVISYEKKGKKRYFKGLRYRLYLLSLKSFLVRRVYIKCLH